MCCQLQFGNLLPACSTHCVGVCGIVLSLSAAGSCCCLLADCTFSRTLLSCVLFLQLFTQLGACRTMASCRIWWYGMCCQLQFGMLLPDCSTHSCVGICGIVLSSAAGPCCCLLADCTSSRTLLSCSFPAAFHVVESLQNTGSL